ncbi:MAG TPA: hypothetical protein VF365_02415 [Candidatus Limnocylindria bacterium]
MPARCAGGVLPIGVSFIGGARDEPQLIGFAYDFEQATLVRLPPPFLSTLDCGLPALIVNERFER